MKGDTVGEAIQAMIDGGAEVRSVQLPAAPAAPVADLGWSEAEFQQAVIGYARERGWKVAHFRKVRVQRKGGKTYWETPVAADSKGFPDLILVREEVIAAELKVGKNRLTVEQREWGKAFTKGGVRWEIWRPSDWAYIVEVLA